MQNLDICSLWQCQLLYIYALNFKVKLQTRLLFVIQIYGNLKINFVLFCCSLWKLRAEVQSNLCLHHWHSLRVGLFKETAMNSRRWAFAATKSTLFTQIMDSHHWRLSCGWSCADLVNLNICDNDKGRNSACCFWSRAELCSLALEFEVEFARCNNSGLTLIVAQYIFDKQLLTVQRLIIWVNLLPILDVLGARCLLLL